MARSTWLGSGSGLGFGLGFGSGLGLGLGLRVRVRVRVSVPLDLAAHARVGQAVRLLEEEADLVGGGGGELLGLRLGLGPGLQLRSVRVA